MKRSGQRSGDSMHTYVRLEKIDADQRPSFELQREYFENMASKGGLVTNGMARKTSGMERETSENELAGNDEAEQEGSGGSGRCRK